MPKNFHKRRDNMADPIIISAAIGLIGRLFDKDKPLGKTNVATAGGITAGGVAAALIQTGEPNAMVAGYVIGVIGTLMALYKEKD